MKKIKSEGKCTYCGKTFAKAGITRHLNNHLKKMTEKPASKSTAFHLRVEGENWFVEKSPWFLNLLVDGNRPLLELDDFLREIWLDCCGHLSSFKDPKQDYDFDFDDYENTDFGEPKKAKMSKVFYEGQVLDYEYDFGSTTYLKIKVLGAYPLKVAGGIQLLSRNEPLHIPCSICQEKLAAQICAVDGTLVCIDCTEKHEKKCEDFADYAAMPIVNSPRMGVCGYMGGAIDQERDIHPDARKWLEEQYDGRL